RLRLDLPHLAGHQVGEVVLLLEQQIGEAVEDLAALWRRNESPLLERRLRCVDRAVDVLRGRAREDTDGIAGGRVDALERLTGDGVDPLAADVVLESLRP